MSETTTTTTPETICKHYRLPMAAPAYAWTAARYQVYTNSLTIGPCHGSDLDALLVRGMDATGDRGEKAICWAMAEERRQQEVRTHDTAIAREAEAIGRLADSIRSQTDQAFLDRLLSRMTDRTRYAIQAQLKDRPL